MVGDLSSGEVSFRTRSGVDSGGLSPSMMTSTGSSSIVIMSVGSLVPGRRWRFVEIGLHLMALAKV